MRIDAAANRDASRALHNQGYLVMPNPWDVGGGRQPEKLGFQNPPPKSVPRRDKTRDRTPARYLATILMTSVLLSPHARASEILPPGLYRVTTEIGMPHLEENLRYATTREKRCLSHQELSSAFPILRHEALTGCKLDHENRQGERVSYVLSCDGAHGTIGTARWQVGADQIKGTLDVRLGGKNMTFYQRVTATPLGECSPETK